MPAPVNITLFVARQKVNLLMLDRLGNLLHAGEPEFLIADRFYWRVPAGTATRDEDFRHSCSEHSSPLSTLPLKLSRLMLSC